MIAADETTTVAKVRKPRRKPIYLQVPEYLREAFERLASAGGYVEGVNELALETYIPTAAIIDAVAESLVRLQDLTPGQIAAVSMVAMEEKLRHGRDDASRWVAEKTLGLEVPRIR